MVSKTLGRVLAVACWAATVSSFAQAPDASGAFVSKIEAQDFDVEATHSTAMAGQCSRVWVVVSGKVKGTFDRGNGLDEVWISVWDDGVLKGGKAFPVVIGPTEYPFTAVLGYEKIWGAERDPGIAVNVGWADGDGSFLHRDPVATTEVAGSCNDPVVPPVYPIAPLVPPGTGPIGPDVPFAPIGPGQGTASIPTLSNWALLLLGAGLAAAGAGAARRRKRRG